MVSRLGSLQTPQRSLFGKLQMVWRGAVAAMMVAMSIISGALSKLASLPMRVLRGELSGAQAGRMSMDYIIELSIGLLIMAAIFPNSITQIFGVSTASWDTQTKLIWAVVPVIAIAGLLFYLWKSGKTGR